MLSAWTVYRAGHALREFRHPVFRTILTSRIAEVRASEQLADGA